MEGQKQVYKIINRLNEFGFRRAFRNCFRTIANIERNNEILKTEEYIIK